MREHGRVAAHGCASFDADPRCGLKAFPTPAATIRKRSGNDSTKPPLGVPEIAGASSSEAS
jgi:hypothetical protein